jgi:hypothetical protein
MTTRLVRNIVLLLLWLLNRSTETSGVLNIFFLRRDYQSKGNQQRRGRYRIRRLVTDDHVTKNDEVNGDEHQDYMVLLVATLFRTNAAAATTVSSGNLTPWSNS